MAQPFVFNRRTTAGKVEATPGTIEALVDADSNVRLYEPLFTPATEMDSDLKYSTSDHTEDIDVAGIRVGTLTFWHMLGNDGTAQGKPNWGKYFDSAGAINAVHSTTGNSYKPRTASDGVSMTIQLADVERGATQSYQVPFVGCMANAVIFCEGPGKPFKIRYEFSGKVGTFADAASVMDLTSPDTTVPYVNLNTTFVIDGVTEKVASFELDLGNEIMPEDDPSDTTGVLQYSIVTRKPRLSINPYKQRVSAANQWNNVNTNNTGTITISNGETPALLITCPQAQPISLADANRQGLSAWDMNYKLLRNGQVGSLTLDNVDNTVEDTWEILIGAKA